MTQKTCEARSKVWDTDPKRTHLKSFAQEQSKRLQPQRSSRRATSSAGLDLNADVTCWQHDPVLKCKLFDMPVRPILFYCCKIWYALGGKAALDDLERIGITFWKILLGVQVHTKTLHVLAEFRRYPLHVTWQLQAANYLSRLEQMPQRTQTSFQC